MINRIYIPYYIRFLLRILAVSMLCMALLRLFLLLFVYQFHLPFPLSHISTPLLIGLQFDGVIMAYLLALPFVLMATMHFSKRPLNFLNHFLLWYFTLLLPLLLFIIIEDIPYFSFFRNRLTESAFQWLNTPKIVFQMILGSAINTAFLIAAIVLVFGLGVWVFKRFKKIFLGNNWVEPNHDQSIKSRILICFLATLFCFIGLRGKLARPIAQGDAFYGNDPVLNQVGLNPAFTLIKSITNKVKLMDNELALTNTLKLLGIRDIQANISPIARKVNGNNPSTQYNVVLVLMESMSGNYMGTFGNPYKLTPTLDSLTHCSWFFNQAYSAGIHTNNGIFSSLYSYPALKRIRPMSAIPTREYSGLPWALKQQGYYNLFFSSHDENFDNLSTFMPANHFDKLYATKDYPADKISGTFGVPDDYLFTFATQKLSQQKAPFFATILTTSNHEPYNVPADFVSHRTEPELRAVNYADWSIGQFLKMAKNTPWFKQTLFVFVSDHGLVVGDNPYDLPLSYHHIPVILYAPEILAEPKTISNFMGQIDIYPTLMGILGYSYTNNTLGTDVLQTPRPAIYFSADNKLGCLNKEWLYVYRFDGGGESLFHYSNADLKDYIQEYPAIKDSLKNYALSQIQTAEYLFNKDLTKIKKGE